MKTMSVYGLLGKIYNCNDDLPKRILFRDRIYELDDYNHYVYEVISGSYGSYIDLFDETSNWELDDFLHEQIAIIENDEAKEKKLPKKLDEELASSDDMLYKINEILDYLESKGE